MNEPINSEPKNEALVKAVLEIESHIAESGWDQGARLYALVDTKSLMASEPELAEAMGLDTDSDDGSLTAVEQDVPPDRALEEVLETVAWPEQVGGCAAVVERLVLPPEVDSQVPEDPVQAQDFARKHPQRQEVRIVAAATRDGATYCAMRLRAHDDDMSVVTGEDLVPGLVALLTATLDEPEGYDDFDEDDGPDE